jgi:MinD-like ATPase involved in chromosome partitioning or flagellar assembly
LAEYEQDPAAGPEAAGSAGPDVEEQGPAAETEGAGATAASRPASLWTQMMTSSGEDDEPGHREDHQKLDDGGLRWPLSGLPPSFGQQVDPAAQPFAPRRPLRTEPPSPSAFVAGGGPSWRTPQAPPPPDPEPRPAAFKRPEIRVMDADAPVEGTPAPPTPSPPPPPSPPQPKPPTRDTPPEGYASQGDQPRTGPPPDSFAARPAPPPESFSAPAPPRSAAPPPPTPDSLNADLLTADLLLPGRHAIPGSGWRRVLYQASGGLVRVPQSAAEQRRQELVLRALTPVAGGHHRVAVLSLKGGVGKTTTTMGLGSTLASLRGDRVVAVDANPDRGTLCDKLRLETAATVRDLLNERDQIERYADVRAYTTQAPSRLEVLASDRDPTVSVAFSAEDYEDVALVLEHFYSICVTDCGTGLLHSAMQGVLRLADQIVLVSSPSVDGARSASATLDWLAAHSYGDLVRSAVVVLSAVRPRSKSAIDLDRLEQHFAARCRAVARIPYDPHLEEGAELDLAQLSRSTADAYLTLAAEVGDGFW